MKILNKKEKTPEKSIHPISGMIHNKIKNIINANSEKIESILDIGGTGKLGVGDISLRNGGPFDHLTHQNGLDVDLRYVRKNKDAEGNVSEANFTFGSHPISDYDYDGTRALMIYFVAEGASVIYADSDSNLGADQILSSYIEYKSDHQDHFHVSFPDPD